MKKLLYVAVMALTMGFFASCNNSPSTGMKYDEGKNPSIDISGGTINGKSYDNETEKCWEMKLSAKYPYAGTITETTYQWATEFVIVGAGETAVASLNHEGVPAGYSYSATSIDNYGDCTDKNNPE